jgi:hypothetical protein
VWGWWLVELQRAFSAVLLKFADGSREVYHSHAFNSRSWVVSLRGPWARTRQEYDPATHSFITMTDGRRVVATRDA